jgi:hypothetical protein
MHLRNLPLRLGGVMRCCIETLDTTEVEEKEGDVLPCKYCRSRLIVRDGAWEWDSKYERTTGDKQGSMQ